MCSEKQSEGWSFANEKERKTRMSKEKKPPRNEIEAGKDEKVREWILSNHPEEKEMIGDFSPTITFREVAERMEKGENFYEICDCSESVHESVVRSMAESRNRYTSVVQFLPVACIAALTACATSSLVGAGA